ncbi:MAG: Bax inhibitor-1/YccA family protein [Acidimicrobiia bacterium]|nr:Bax inhibitor-1/YccA family protein [Acidimicrobiia bacterium]
MRTMNPALNDSTFEKAASDWAPPSGQPHSIDTSDRMTFSGTLTATAVLTALVLVGAVFGWNAVSYDAGQPVMPGWFFVALIAGLGIAVLTIFKPKFARVTAPLYSLVQGTVVGAISAIYNSQYDGIVLQAVGLTLAVLAIMVFLYATRIIQVTEKLRMGIVAATGAVALIYVVTMVIGLFGGNVPYIHDSGAIGILFSLAVVGVASFNLLLDFDLIERGVKAGAPPYMEWYASFGLIVTLVWLYLEMLRLLSKLRR